MTPARLATFAMSTIGFAVSNSRSARRPMATDPNSPVAPKYSAARRVPVSSTSYGVIPSSTHNAISRCIENPGTRKICGESVPSSIGAPPRCNARTMVRRNAFIRLFVSGSVTARRSSTARSHSSTVSGGM